eukprot:Nk52_evm4s2226 gene=Nk52_evmTU4s2226
MPLRLDIRRKLSSRSDRVKSVDLHPTEPWMLVSLYDGTVHIWDYEAQNMIKTFEVSELPCRCARFIHRKNWVIAGADDHHLRVYNYNTLEKTATFEAHSDYIRCLAVHPSQPYVISSSDDMLIKLWDWEKGWQCSQVYEGHTHFIMTVKFNPKDTNTFASACMDRTVKVWQLGSPVANFTLQGHEKGVNYVDYFQGGDKPHLISSGDDRMAKIWDYQSKTCVQTLEGHTHNVSVAAFHPELPIILTGSEDGTVRIWHSTTYRLENTLNYGLDRVWSLAYMRGSNIVAIGYDEGSIVIKLGRDEPSLSMDSSGKIIFSRHNEIQQANVKTVGDQEFKDGERLPLTTKELGSCEVFPQSLIHNPNGRFVCVCGDGEYIIYTALAWRNKSFGQALEFVWAADAGVYAIRESSSKIKIFKNFKESHTLKRDYSAEGIFGGVLLGVRSSNTLAFYDWESGDLIRRIDIVPRVVKWSDSGEMVAICTEDSYFILRFSADVAKAAIENKEAVSDEGIEDTFEVVGEVQESVKTCCWVGDTFIYTNAVNRLNYYVGGEIVTISHLDRPLFLLGYIPRDNKMYLADKDLNIVSYSLDVSVLEYQTAIMRDDFETADSILPSIPDDQRNRVARFLEKQGFKEQALVVSKDLEHKFELAVALEKLDIAYNIALETQNDHKWKVLGDKAMENWRYGLAEQCLKEANDFSGLLLFYAACGKTDGISSLAEKADKEQKNNIAFVCNFLLNNVDGCLDLLCKTSRFPEAAFMARTYAPSRVSDIVALWKDSLDDSKKKIATAIADPTEYENLFPGFDQELQMEMSMKGSVMKDERERESLPKEMPAALSNDLQSMNLNDDVPEPKIFSDSSSKPATTEVPAPSEPAPLLDFEPEPQPEKSTEAFSPPAKEPLIDFGDFGGDEPAAPATAQREHLDSEELDIDAELAAMDKDGATTADFDVDFGDDDDEDGWN